MVHLLALWRVELHLSNRLAEEQGSMPCTSWPALDNSSRRPSSGKEEIIWRANHRAGNRRNQAALGLKRIRRPTPKPRRARSGWLTSAGTTGLRISSSPAGNGSPAGAAARWFTRRKRSWLTRLPRADSGRLRAPSRANPRNSLPNFAETFRGPRRSLCDNPG
jgi:hypothetical protein